MRFLATQLADAFEIDLERHEDERGFFARSFCEKEFEAQGLATVFPQCNVSYNRHKGTVRGMHYQAAPDREAKLVRCTAGAIWDVIVDLRPSSRTHLRWTAVELTAENRRMLYVPEGFAHGFQILADDSEIFYQMSAFYAPDSARGFRWDDPQFALPWPLAVSVISENDRGLPPFELASFDG